MRRRTVLLGGLGLTLTGCAKNDPTPPGGNTDPVILPSGGITRVVAWTISGGFLPVGFEQLNAPRLVVYSDGTAVSDAQKTLNIGISETVTLIAELRTALARIPPTAAPDRGDQMVMDAATTYIEVLQASGERRSVAVYALEELEYPRPLREANARLSALAQRVHAGAAYIGDRIRVVAVSHPDTRTVGRWPESVPVPPVVHGGDPGTAIDDVRMADVSGPAAQALAAAMPREAAQPDGGQWPVLHTREADNLAVAWRYLLPDE